MPFCGYSFLSIYLLRGLLDDSFSLLLMVPYSRTKNPRPCWDFWFNDIDNWCCTKHQKLTNSEYVSKCSSLCLCISLKIYNLYLQTHQRARVYNVLVYSSQVPNLHWKFTVFRKHFISFLWSVQTLVMVTHSLTFTDVLVNRWKFPFYLFKWKRKVNMVEYSKREKEISFLFLERF